MSTKNVQICFALSIPILQRINSFYLDKGEIEISAGCAHEPDVWFETDRSTAISLFEGMINPLNAVIEGKMEIGGDPRKLIEASEMFEQLGDVFETIRDSTVTNAQ